METSEDRRKSVNSVADPVLFAGSGSPDSEFSQIYSDPDLNPEFSPIYSDPDLDPAVIIDSEPVLTFKNPFLTFFLKPFLFLK